ncbi:hypothetical protein CSB95_5451 [Pseudomonas aeruginosa]|uniref:DUF1320 domain-containing protein n=1 Tax=Pseudomonas aeruginosa TaxID=287 RepID=UPI000D436687|nr:DUF1320 domain-containing protein [Pseudomonas aeruginosa]PRW19878.1 hypothetical protein CSB95_5451 [Pseudomonas aeruginosa]
MTEAESIVNGYLAKRGYGLPLSPVPGLVTGWVRDIGRYLLHKDRIFRRQGRHPAQLQGCLEVPADGRRRARSVSAPRIRSPTIPCWPMFASMPTRTYSIASS